MSYRFESLLNYYKELWYELPSSTSVHTPVSKILQRTNNKSLIDLKKQLILLLKKNSSQSIQECLNKNDRDTIKAQILTFMTGTLELPVNAVAILDEETYYEVTMAFIERARETCPDLDLEGITQALRNMWVIMALQIYMGEPVVLTDAAFGYSMLYPLTDNYMDEPDIATAHKKSFNKRFHLKIKDNTGHGENPSEILIFHMIDLINGDYDRLVYPQVTESLLAILDGQNKSLDQHNLNSPFDIDLLGYTFYKGGTSVLADAYLVRGSLSEEEAMFAFGYGAILQLADDLEDIDCDMMNQHHTTANTQSRLGNMDTYFDKYRKFITIVFDRHYELDTDRQKALSKLLDISINHLLMSAVYSNSHHFSREWFRQFERSSLFTKKAQHKLNHKLKRLSQSCSPKSYSMEYGDTLTST